MTQSDQNQHMMRIEGKKKSEDLIDLLETQR